MERLPSRGQSARGGVLLRKQGGGCAEAGTNFPTAFFFAAVACRRQRLGAIHRKSFRGGARPPQARGWVCGSRHKFPHRLFFCGCRLSAAAAGSHPPPAAAKSTVPQVVQLFGQQQRRQKPPPQAFSWSGSSRSGDKSTVAAIDRYLGSNSEELKHNGYVLCKGKSLKEFKLQFGSPY